MKLSAVIAEFNPFHNGHKYLIDKARETSDGVIAVMSGSFVQRGDVAIFDKWTRARSALLNGVDLVLELPCVFASSTAERFASGAIGLISHLGCVDQLYFGSESGDIDVLLDASMKLCNESWETSLLIKKYLDSGESFPKAREKAYEGLISPEIFSSPNNILALEYLKAISLQNSNLKPVTIKRQGTDYHSLKSSGEFASATLIRSFINEGKAYSDFVPENLKSVYQDTETYSLSNLNDTILYLLRTCDPLYLASINDVTEGLENRLKELSKYECDIFKLADMAASKRYPKSRIMRIFISLLLGIDKEIIYDKVSYARVLGFNDNGRSIINEIKKGSEIPIITKTADYKEDNKMFNKDLLSTDIASLSSNSKTKKTGGKDFTMSPVYIN